MTNSPTYPPPSVTPPATDPATPAPGARSHAVSPVRPMTALHYRRTVEQVVTPNDYPRLTSLVRTLAPDTGSVRQLGDGLLWEQDSGYSMLALTINPEPAGTVIRADVRMDGRVFMYYFGSVAASLFGGFATASVLSPLAGIGVGLGLLVPAGFAARALARKSAERSMRQLQELVDRIAAAIRGELE